MVFLRRNKLRLRAVFLLLSLPATILAAADVCYDANGYEASSLGQTPCFTGREYTTCCQPGMVCISNGLCVDTPQRAQHYNGTYPQLTVHFTFGCTDARVQDVSCQAAVSCNQKAPGTFGLIDCGSSTYCCYGYGGCSCSAASQVISLPTGSIIGFAPFPTSSISTDSAAKTSSAMAQTLTSSTTLPQSTLSSNTGLSSYSPGLSTDAKVGLGVGIPSAVVAIGTMARWIFKRGRTQ